MAKKKPRSIGQQLKARREALGLSQTEAAKLVGLSQPYYSQLELDHRNPAKVYRDQRDFLQRIADGLGLPFDELAEG